MVTQPEVVPTQTQWENIAYYFYPPPCSKKERKEK